MEETLADYSKRELGRIEKERQEAIKAKGGLPFLPKLELGTNRLTLQAKAPSDNIDPSGNPKKLFTVSLDGNSEEFSWSVNPRSPLYRDLLEVLPKAPVKLEVIRTGTNRQDTRYSLKLREKA